MQTAVPQSGLANENQVKAAYLYNFAKFVRRSDTALPAPTYPFTICILGADFFGNALDNALLGRSIAEHPVMIVRLPKRQDLSGCQIVFISSSESSQIPMILAELKGHNPDGWRV